MYYSPAETRHTDDVAILRDYVERIKNRHGHSQRDQAAALGVGWTTMRDWLNGKARWPKSAQVALEGWAFAPLAEDEDGIVALCQIGPSLDDERALIAAWKRVRSDDQSYNLATTVKDWPVEDLQAFARNGHQDKGFQEAVRAQLLDAEGDALPMPARGADALYRKAYEWCTPAVLERFADLLD